MEHSRFRNRPEEFIDSPRRKAWGSEISDEWSDDEDTAALEKATREIIEERAKAAARFVYSNIITCEYELFSRFDSSYDYRFFNIFHHPAKCEEVFEYNEERM